MNMNSKLLKLSKDLIIYSVLVSEFERLDFKDDALAGVRANYFNAKCSPQVEKTDIKLGGKMQSLSYSLRRGEPLSWKITCDASPVQTVKRASDGSYSVMSYGSNGIIFKRQFFDISHEWQRTEYYDSELENRLLAVIYSFRSDGLIVLRLQRVSANGITTVDLYPSLTAPKKRCAALIYSNTGMLWYDNSFKPDQVTVEDASDKKGFRFSREAFISENVTDSLNLKEAPYLSTEDILRGDKAVDVPAAEEPKEYSAYEKIENILFEAHKTNKNIFGELAVHSANEESIETEEPEIADELELTEEPVQVTELEAAAEVIETEQPQATEAPDTASEADNTEEPRTAENPEIADDSELCDEPSKAIALAEPEADSVIKTRQGNYTYFGSLDDNGKRTGRGRTVTPNGLTAYDGEYSDDKRHGFGVCYYKDGSANYIGNWETGNRSGKGVGFRRSDGTMHAGKWYNNMPDGFGARFDKSGDFLDVCTYVDGRRSGKSVSFDEDGNVVIRLWKDGEMVSERIISD